MASMQATHGPTMTLSQDPLIVTVIERFDMPEDLQAQAVQLAETHISRTWRSDPGFVGAALLRCRNRGGLSCHAQWRRPSDRSSSTNAEAPAASQSLAEALQMFRSTSFRRMDSRTYTLDFSGAAEGAPTPSLMSVAKTPCAHFGVFAVTRETQNHLLDLARSDGTKSLGTPGLQSINFYRSLDGKRVINLGLWTDFDGWGELLQQPGFTGNDMYWENAVDDWQPDFFDVVAIEVVN